MKTAISALEETIVKLKDFKALHGVSSNIMADKAIEEIQTAIGYLKREAIDTVIEIPTDKEIENYSKIFNNAMTSMAEGSWVPVGVVYGAKWMRDKLSPYLKRKVKKDPRVDGLPESKKTLLIWKVGEDVPLGGYYNLSRNKWIVFTSAKPYTTDEILFYADPNEIV